MQRTKLSTREKLEARQSSEQKTGYRIQSTNLLNQIFRRSSLAAELGRGSNEILEFIGDQVLSYYTVKYVSEKSGFLSLHDDYTFQIRENRFTQIKQSLINNESLAAIAEDWGICKYLLLGKSDINNGVADETKVKADLLEAVIGAIAVDSNWNVTVLQRAVVDTLSIEQTINKMIESEQPARQINMDNSVSTLKEMAEHGFCTMPDYAFVGPDAIGCDAEGKPKWVCTCKVIDNRTGWTKCVEAESKKAAKKAAAYLLLCDLLGLLNQYGPNKCHPFWRLQGDRLIPIVHTTQ